MKLTNNIGWCDVTGNAVIGCTEVSPGCVRCYAREDTPARVLRHRGTETWGKNGTRVKIAGFAAKARKLNRYLICADCRETHRAEVPAAHCGGVLRRIRFFADSNSDWLDEKWPIETLAELLKLIHETPNLDWLLLTKRPKNFLSRIEGALRFVERLPDHLSEVFPETPLGDWINEWTRMDGEGAPSNVWIGTSVEDQTRADERIPALLKIPAKVRFLSCEPLLGPLVFDRATPDGSGGYWQDLDWIICGGESGPGARPMHPDWSRSLRDQCAAAVVPFFFKQWGNFCLGDRSTQHRSATWLNENGERASGASYDPPLARGGRSWVLMQDFGKKAAGRLLDGVEHNAFPEPRARWKGLAHPWLPWNARTVNR